VGAVAASLMVSVVGNGADHSYPSNGELKNAWSCTSIQLVRLHVVAPEEVHGIVRRLFVAIDHPCNIASILDIRHTSTQGK
jgi:hypothetical protein